jgi:hypothetical protein
MKEEFGIKELPQVLCGAAIGMASTQTSGSFLLRQRLGEVWSGFEDFQRTSLNHAFPPRRSA